MGKKDSASATLVIAAKLADFANLNAAVMSFLPFDAGFSPAGIDDGSVASDRSRRCDVSHTIVDWDESQITAVQQISMPGRSARSSRGFGICPPLVRTWIVTFEATRDALAGASLIALIAVAASSTITAASSASTRG